MENAVCGSPKNSTIFVLRETEGGIAAETKNHHANHRSHRVVCTYCGGTKERIRSHSDVHRLVQAKPLCSRGEMRIYHSPTPAEAVADMATEDAKFFTVIDAMKGYLQ